jgi:hypothetical protein
MKFLLAFVLGGHGVAHVAGFVASWRLMSLAELPYKTTTLGGRLELGDAGVRILGVLWLAVALAFLGSAVAVATEARAARLIIVASMLSLTLCAAEWPAAPLGLAVDIALLTILLTTLRSWIPVN